MFAMEEPWAVPDRGGLRWRPEPIENGTTKFEIELTVTDAPAGPRVRVNYNRDLFHEATGQLVADGFTAILRCLRDDPGLAVTDAEIMSPDALALVTRVWPDGGPVADPDATAVAQLWAACASDAVVAAGPDGELTGTEVRDLARRIAAAVRGHRAGVGDQVAILLPRGARFLPAILGVWSAGASYVPLDPIYPAKRLATMLSDSGAAAIVIDSSVERAPVPPPASPSPFTAAPIPVVDLAGRRDGRAGAGPAAVGHRADDLHLGIDRPAKGGQRDPGRHRPANGRPVAVVRPRPPGPVRRGVDLRVRHHRARAALAGAVRRARRDRRHRAGTRRGATVRPASRQRGNGAAGDAHRLADARRRRRHP